MELRVGEFRSSGVWPTPRFAISGRGLAMLNPDKANVYVF